jgi:protein SCO1/2
MITASPARINAQGTETYRRPRHKGVNIRAGASTLVLALVAALGAPVLGHEGEGGAALRKIGPAPGFTLTRQDGARVSLADLRGKVVAVTFIYASCADTCPLLTAKMAGLQSRLGTDFGSRVRFVSITVDPERDTPAVLEQYAEAHGADRDGWAFLTGTPEEIREVARRYGVVYRKTARGDVDHTFLTSVIDQAGTLRVQYLGVRFDPDELLADLRSLLREAGPR